jgi:hypothetical protein
MANEKPSVDGKFRIDFIDPLFAVAIHIGFVEGLMNEPWLAARSFPSTSTQWADISLFVAGIWVIVASWVGYHLSIQKRPLTGNMRFYLDIVLLVAYVFLLIYFQSPAGMAILLALIYLVYIAWDYFKVREHPDGLLAPPGPWMYLRDCFCGFLAPSAPTRLHGEVVTLGWAVVFVVLAPYAVFISAINSDLGKAIFAGLVMATNYLYRIDKTWRGAIITFPALKLGLFAALFVDLLLFDQFVFSAH